jgi:hypothetical protein
VILLVWLTRPCRTVRQGPEVHHELFSELCDSRLEEAPLRVIVDERQRASVGVARIRGAPQPAQ